MSKRDAYIAAMKARLDEWSAELHRLEAKAEKAEANVADRYRRAIAELREKRDDAEAKLDEIRHAGEDAWEDLKDEAEKTWTAVKAALDVFRDFSDRS